jgi:hypothetical protein
MVLWGSAVDTLTITITITLPVNINITGIKSGGEEI